MSSVRNFHAEVLEEIANPALFPTTCYLRIGIFEDDTQIGEYIRNYPYLLNTFHPFKQGDKWFALYSKDYTATRVMSLPDCTDLGGEEKNSSGFCPADFYVPWDNEDLLISVAVASEFRTQVIWIPGEFGFVSGCIWGDDSSWKLRFIDLTNCADGNIEISERFGYLPLYEGRLKDLISFYGFFQNEPFLEIAERKTVSLGKKVT